MKELSLHILDIVENSIKAGGTLIEITVDEKVADNWLFICIKDNGKGMSKAFLEKVRDPFTTTRTTRKVGMGIPLFQSAAQATGGKLEISSELGVGTEVTALFQYNHIDRQPIGDMAQTMAMLIQANPAIDFVYTHRVDERAFVLDTREIKATLDGVPIEEPDIIIWLKEYMHEHLNEIGGCKV